MTKKIAILTLTQESYQLGKKLKNQLVDEKVSLFGLEKQIEKKEEVYPEGEFKKGFPAIFQSFDALICIMATGIVVRHIASLIEDKRVDPAIIVIDEKGEFVISLLSGHVGGANALTRKIATVLSAQAVITTATDVQGVTAIDTMSQAINGWYENFKETTKYVNGLLASGKCVALIDLENRVTDIRGLKKITELDEKTSQSYDAIILVSSKLFNHLPENCYQIIPKEFTLGIGAKRGTPLSVIMEELHSFCQLYQIQIRSIKELVSIDLKKDELGIVQLASSLDVPFNTYTKEQLLESSLKFPQSEFVKSVVGIGNVALSSVDYATKGHVLTKRYAHNGVTFALGKG